jgi:predicted dehydrogenase
MSNKLRIGFIGCGEIAVVTAKATDECENAQVTYAMDVEKGLAKNLAEARGAKWTTDAGELIKSDEVDAVYICTPHFLHAPMAIKAARAGKNVLCEKPIATTLKDAEKMVVECRKAGVVLTIAFCERYRPSAIKARELIAKGMIGDFVGTYIALFGDKKDTYWTGGYSGRAKTDWRTKKKMAGGGILIMNAIHNIDLMRWMTGMEANRVMAQYATRATSVEVEDIISVSIRYKNGAIGSVYASSCSRGGRLPSFERGDCIYGTEGQICVSSALHVWTRKRIRGFKKEEWQEVELKPLGKNARSTWIDDTANAIANGTDPPITGGDGFSALAIIAAAYKSGKKGKAVKIAKI